MYKSRRWVRLLTKAPVNMSNNVHELLKYYCEQKKLEEFPKPWKCYCCHKEKFNMVAAFVVDAYGWGNRNLYIIFICLDCLEDRIKEPENPATFQVLCEDLLPVSKYELLSDFVNLSVEEL